MKNHHLICGYGMTGRAAAKALIAQGIAPTDVVVVDSDPESAAAATDAGFTVVRGDAARVTVLEQAAIDRAASVIVTPNRDDTAVLITLTSRELNPSARIVATVRERENLHLLRQSGADAAIDAAAAVGRLVGIATQTPGALDLIDDLLEPGTRLEVFECTPVVAADGTCTSPDGVNVIEVLRNGDRLPFDDPAVRDLRASDRLMAVRSVS